MPRDPRRIDAAVAERRRLLVLARRNGGRSRRQRRAFSNALDAGRSRVYREYELIWLPQACSSARVQTVLASLALALHAQPLLGHSMGVVGP